METKALREMGDVERVRAELARAKQYADDTIQIIAVDRADAETLHAKLTDDERNHVRITWLIK